jgi:hypothetical protein
MLRRLLKFSGRNLGSALLVVALIVSLGLNVVLARRLDGGRSPSPRSAASSVIGKPVSPLVGVAPDGGALTVSLGGVETVIYRFSPRCIWCQRNYANIAALARSVGSRYRFIGLSVEDDLGELRQDLREHPLPFSVIRVGSDALPDWLRLATPAALVVGRDGVVTTAWIGAFSQDNAQGIEKFFHVRLPGLIDAGAK